MKRIVAIIRPEKFEDVKRELIEVGCEGMTVSEVKGRGSQKGIRESYRGSNFCIDLIPKTRIEIVVNDDRLDLIVDKIIEGAYTGNIGDGKIFIQSVDNVIRIRTNEHGDEAV
ncbi:MULTISPECIES: P-II family nitrogen regulator [Methanobrevibacter]|uniref:Nitrogen regulatory protein P-II family n=1 Tax=Methanobrevibacter gottschalkii DSM 11977 TaxID=1122229 RepID=A0A3N5BYD5_9EURY|nr:MULTISPECIES: P-II family nitrogen regulator [Methanobrevibacter]OED00647.1 transcriptional regulator [Methanobrevibacter sp. A27]RPF50845.1 nitrogen regulatory protein P-II family [Methanobrevibacter gottschalkii DSM 11977]